MTNRNFGKLTDGAITYAPVEIVVDGKVTINPSAVHYLAAGWKAVNASAPTLPAPNGYHYEADGWTETYTKISRKWKTVSNAVIPRKFSKLKIYAAISSLDADNSAATWEKVQTWLEGKTVNGMNGWIAFQLAQEISEDHPLFAAWSEEARVLLGIYPEEFEKLLAACVLEG